VISDGGGGFSAEETRQTLVKACTQAGLEVEGAELMRLGENAVYRLVAEPVVVRIARSVDYLADVQTEVAVARWLEEAEFPAVRLVGPADQPLVVDERVVSFWELTTEQTEYGTVTELAVLLRRLHSLERPSWLHLPPLRPFRKVERRIERVSISESDRVFLRERLAELRKQYSGLRFALPTSTIHGDANIGNIIRKSDGQAVLIDLDGFAVGPPEWDLTLTAVYYDRMGWHTANEYAAFTDTYGFDVMAWPGYPVLRDIRELIMVTWLAQNTGESQEIADEVAKRIADLRRGDGRRDWAPY
jgi:aminoglycoside phosphotransferase (APT) family kinase protein